MRLDEPGREGGRERGGWDGEEEREGGVKRNEIKRNAGGCACAKVKRRI